MVTVVPPLADLALLVATRPTPILLLEPDEAVATLVHVVLTEAGYATVALDQWDDALVLQTLADRQPAAVLANGSYGAAAAAVWALAQRLHAHDPGLPVVLFTTDEQTALGRV